MGLLSTVAGRLGYVPREKVDPLVARVGALEARALRDVASRKKSSGVPFSYGQFEYERNTKLRSGTTKWDTLRDMTTDPHVKGALRATILPMLSAEWDVVPGSDSAKDAEVADFVKANLLRIPSERYGSEYFVETSWRQRLYEALDMLESGFSMFHRTTKISNGKRCYKRIHWLEPRSVDPRGWVVGPDDTLVEVMRSYKDSTGYTRFLDPVPAAELSLYPWEFKGARYEGEQFIRSMYGAWARKDFILKAAVMFAQKVGNPPLTGAYPRSFDTEQQLRFEEFIQSARTAEAEAYFVGPMESDGAKAEVSYLASEHHEVDRMRGLIDGENAEIAHGGSTKSQLLGETETGSRALGQSLSATEYLHLQAVAETLCDYMNNGCSNLAGEVEELVAWNFAGVKNMPRLTCSKIHPDWALRGITEVIEAAKAGILPAHNPEFRKQFALRVGLDLPDEVYEEETEPLVVPGEPGEEPEPEEPDERPPAYESTALAMDELRAPMAGASKMGRRVPTVLEARYVDVAAAAQSFREGERDVLVTLRDIHWRMIEELMGRVRSGKIVARNIESQRRSKFRGSEQAVSEVVRVLESVSIDGAAHVKAELGRQRGQ